MEFFVLVLIIRCFTFALPRQKFHSEYNASYEEVAPHLLNFPSTQRGSVDAIMTAGMLHVLNIVINSLSGPR